MTGLFILIGGEIDAEIEQAAPSGKEPGDTQLSHASRASDSAGTVFAAGDPDGRWRGGTKAALSSGETRHEPMP